jgi:DNA (cytosine-5)-methyltransferase 1
VIGEGIRRALADTTSEYISSELVSQSLAAWFQDRTDLRIPWLGARSRWQVLSAEILLDRATAECIRSLWPLLSRWTQPVDTLASADELLMIAGWIRREQRADELLTFARHLVQSSQADLDDDVLADLVKAKALLPAQADMAALVIAASAEGSSEEPVIVNKGVLRVAANFTGEAVNARNRLTDGRVAVARMIGYGPRAREAHLALMELSNTLCRPVTPDCVPCPIAQWCEYARGTAARSVRVEAAAKS